MWLHKIADKYGYRLCVDLSKDVKRKKKEMKKIKQAGAFTENFLTTDQKIKKD